MNEKLANGFRGMSLSGGRGNFLYLFDYIGTFNFPELLIFLHPLDQILHALLGRTATIVNFEFFVEVFLGLFFQGFSFPSP